MTLREAVGLLEEAPAPDAWFVRVSGEITAGDNVLIPSTVDALTSGNYRKNKGGPDRETAGSRLFTRQIESGVVTLATWLMIRAMPPALRADYEGLAAGSLVFYPTRAAGRDGAEYDRLVGQLGRHPLPWEAELDLRAMKKTVTERIDSDFVSLAFPVKDFARSISERRERARSGPGEGGAEDRAWKQLVNTIYGVLANPHYQVGNAVAANQITAAGRARAWAMVACLNGIQVVTDGCTFRADQVPACTLAECLRLQPDFLVRRAEEGGPIPFLDSTAIPPDDEGFTAWFEGHALGFFGVAGAEFEDFFGTHALEFKRTIAGISFDALACVGSGSYAKCRRVDTGSIEILDQAMRGQGPASKSAIGPWAVETYANDRLEVLPPLARNRSLLSAKEALRKARGALHRGLPGAIVPLGYESFKIYTYQAIRLSAFVCRTPAQWKSLDRQFRRFSEANGCGMEVLALRRGYADRPSGSVATVAQSIYAVIQGGGRDIGKALHLTRESLPVARASRERLLAKAAMIEEESARLEALIDPDLHDVVSLRAAIVCHEADRPPLA